MFGFGDNKGSGDAQTQQGQQGQQGQQNAGSQTPVTAPGDPSQNTGVTQPGSEQGLPPGVPPLAGLIPAIKDPVSGELKAVKFMSPEQQAAQNKQQNPLDAFKALLEPAKEPTKEEKEAAAAKAPLTVQGLLTDDVVKGLKEKVDFTSFISAETIKALEGEKPVDAFKKAIAEASQGAFINALQTSGHLMQQVLDSQLQAQQGNFSSLVNDTLVQQTVRKTAADKHPVAGFMLGMISEQVKKYSPDASPEWIAQQAQNLLEQTGKAFAPQQDQQTEEQSYEQEKAAGNIDWIKFAASQQGQAA